MATGTTNSQVVSAQIDLFLCPAAPPSRVQHNKHLSKIGVTDYSPIIGILQGMKNPYVQVKLPPSDSTGRGALGQDVFRKPTDITDGLSNTIAFAESAGRPQTWIMGQRVGTDGPPWPGGPLAIRARLGGWAQYLNPLELAGIDPTTNIGLNYPGPCLVSCHNGQDIYSFHSGGANVLMADGSVKFLGQGVSYATVILLVVRNDGLTFDDPF